MKPDEVIQEVRAVKERIAAEHGHDVNRLAATLEKRQKEHPDRVVPPPARRSSSS